MNDITVGALTFRVSDTQAREAPPIPHESTLLADDAAKLRSLFGVNTGVDIDHILTQVGTPTQLRRALNWYAAQAAQRALSTPHTSVPTPAHLVR